MYWHIVFIAQDRGSGKNKTTEGMDYQYRVVQILLETEQGNWW